MYALDRLITNDAGLRIFYPGEGIHLHVPDPLPESEFVSVRIEAIDWPRGSFVEAHFVHTVCGWVLYQDGTINTPHLTPFCDNLSFSPTSSGLGLKLVTEDAERRTMIASNIRRITDALRTILR